MIGGKKIAVLWHVYDLEVSHVEPKEVSKFMEWLVGIYKELSITRGRVHK